MEIFKNMVKYDTCGAYIRADKIVWVHNQPNEQGVVVISEDGDESRGNMTAEQVIDQISFTLGGGT